MSNVTIFRVLWDIFLVVWVYLDEMFTWIDAQFKLVFDAIPETAIPFLIGICCYSVCAFMHWGHEKLGKTRKALILKSFYVAYFILMILFTFWRLGLISKIDDEVTAYTLGEFLFNLAYIIFFMILIISFMKKIDWLQKAIISFLWACFTLFTFVIGPLIGEITLSFDTLTQFLIVGVIFVIPNGMYRYRKSRTSGDSSKSQGSKGD